MLVATADPAPMPTNDTAGPHDIGRTMRTRAARLARRRLTPLDAGALSRIAAHYRV
ncbi:hypothetical protein C7S16_1278 [Burkholderia thailandensis]|uniref:Uncharacterized protein n=1 Tax=Burkholderia thailandensis TaxID=57975 RepID=A0AAW9D0U9_BURTH|nr:hypothetical protein [Burkholderia thailandensis]